MSDEDKKWTDFSDDEQYPAWNKEDKVGEVLEGILASKRLGVGTDNLNFYTIEEMGGEKVSILGRKIVNDFLGSMPVGTEIKIEYLGKKEPKGQGRPYHGYKCQYNKETMPGPDLAKDIVIDV